MSDLSGASIHVQLGAGDKAGIVGSEEDDGLGEFFGTAQAAHDDGRSEGLQMVGVGERLIEKRGIDWTRADDVDSNMPVLEVRGPRTSKRTHGSLSRRVDAE